MATNGYSDRSDYSDSDLLAEAITLLRWAEAEMEEGEASRDIGRFLDMVTP